MKAILVPTDAQIMLTLTPENAGDEKTLHEFGLRTGRAHIINCRGFKYMHADVEFLVQPMPAGDRA
jgi:hypothetical protein